jgi:hypothetical protein
MDVLNRKTLTVFNQKALDGIIQGCASVKWPFTTGIDDVERSSFNVQHSIYDLQGRLLAKTPDRGIFIKDGKKYIR